MHSVWAPFILALAMVMTLTMTITTQIATALAIALAFSEVGHAGYAEVGASVNYRYSGFDPNNYVQSLTYTASASYNFWEMCAWELDYTTGYSKQVSEAPGDPESNPRESVQDNIQFTSLDLVLSLADRDDAFRPYVKIGGGYLIKDRYLQIDDEAPELIASQKGLVPSGGLGFAYSLTRAFNLKLGIDAWSSPLNVQPVVLDYVGRAGISWIF